MGASGDEPDIRSDVRGEIREFLTTRRDRISPQQAALPTYGGNRRRVPGLRREEVALLAGVSTDYYTRLERGSATGVSESVVDGVARALQLNDAERTHLYDLVRTAGGTGPPRRRRPTPERVRPTVQRIVDSMHGTPALVLNRRLGILAANALGLALFAPVYADARGPQQRPVRVPRPPRHRVLPRLGHRRQRHRRPAGQRSTALSSIHRQTTPSRLSRSRRLTDQVVLDEP